MGIALLIALPAIGVTVGGATLFAHYDLSKEAMQALSLPLALTTAPVTWRWMKTLKVTA